MRSQFALDMAAVNGVQRLLRAAKIKDFVHLSGRLSIKHSSGSRTLTAFQLSNLLGTITAHESVPVGAGQYTAVNSSA